MSQCDENESQSDENESQSDKRKSQSGENESKCDPRDFEQYIDEKLKKLRNCDKEFLRKLGVFSQDLLQHVYIGRRIDTYDDLDKFVKPVNLSALIDGGFVDWNSKLEAVTVGRFILKMAKPIREEMRTVIKNDFPKFLGERANFWRYLLHLISEFISCGGADNFTSRFLLTNACYVELTSYCHEIDQFSVSQHDKIVWIMMMLHYFGDRLKEERRNFEFVLNLPLIANKKTGVNNVNKEEEKPKEEKRKNKEEKIIR